MNLNIKNENLDKDIKNSKKTLWIIQYDLEERIGI